MMNIHPFSKKYFVMKFNILYKKKLKKIREYINKNLFDFILLTTHHNINYLSSFSKWIVVRSMNSKYTLI